ncbi:MAG: universal stress protein [Myxococcota bacterium]
MRISDHIVVAVDFSEPSRIAVRAAQKMAEITKARQLTVMHALRPTVLPHGKQPELTRRLVELRGRIHDAARDQMNKMVGDMSQSAFTVDTKVVEGMPARVIPAAARDLGATMLAVGTHARRGVRRWLKGSVVESMLPHLHLPTLVFAVGDDNAMPDVELASLKHVTIALDTQDSAQLVANRARTILMGLSERPKVTLTTVVDVDSVQLAPDPGLVSQVRSLIEDDARTRLGQMRNAFVADGFEVEVEVRTGDIEDEILAVAAATPSQMIIMGTHGSGEALVNFSSMAADVIRHSQVSVLVLPCHPGLEPPQS